MRFQRLLTRLAVAVTQFKLRQLLVPQRRLQTLLHTAAEPVSPTDTTFTAQPSCSIGKVYPRRGQLCRIQQRASQ
jgi:hypothetical protein